MNIKELIFKLNYLLSKHGEDCTVITLSDLLIVCSEYGNEIETIDISE